MNRPLRRPLTIGERVQFPGDPTDLGTVVEVLPAGAIVLWDTVCDGIPDVDECGEFGNLDRFMHRPEYYDLPPDKPLCVRRVGKTVSAEEAARVLAEAVVIWRSGGRRAS